ncbi:MAG TPA: electron transfer flavoprotein subunit alpha/FixB family protein [Dehalococcoidia bacterium]|nr:electron transfer flavoprotein subunit alpha/FixB family protein [Dehalococcoidia bacterium]
MSDNKGILVLGEIANGDMSATTTEILGCARRLADELKESVTCVLISDQMGDAPQKAIKFGADKIITVTDASFKDYQNDTFAMALEKIIKDNSPKLVLMAQSSIGRDLAPTVAFRNGVGLAMDCLDIKIDDAGKYFELTRSVYGGNAQATFMSEDMPQIATIRQKAMSPIVPDDARKGEIVPVQTAIDTSKIKIRVIETVKEEVAGIKLEDAPVIVTGGRGIGGNEGFKQLEELARTLKGAVGATRPPCDNGWSPETSQVGLTGKIVSPDLYIAVAVSGASQHMAGCSGAKNIIAINKDAESNIFKFSRFGIVGDWKQVLPALTEKVKKLVSS